MEIQGKAWTFHLWLRGLERYIKDKNQIPSKWGSYASHWLSGQAKKLWDCELNEMEDKGEAPNLEIFH